MRTETLEELAERVGVVLRAPQPAQVTERPNSASVVVDGRVRPNYKVLAEVRESLPPAGEISQLAQAQLREDRPFQAAQTISSKRVIKVKLDKKWGKSDDDEIPFTHIWGNPIDDPALLVDTGKNKLTAKYVMGRDWEKHMEVPSELRDKLSVILTAREAEVIEEHYWNGPITERDAARNLKISQPVYHRALKRAEEKLAKYLPEPE